MIFSENSQLTTKYIPARSKSNLRCKPQDLYNDIGEQTPILPFLIKNQLLYRHSYIIRGMLGCIGGLFLHLVIGSLYQWGLLNPYITSYFRLQGYSNLLLTDTVVIFPIMMFCLGTTMPLGLYLGAKYGYCKTLLCSNVGCAGFIFASSFADNLFIFSALYSVGFGLTSGLTFMVPMKICNQYFPNKQPYVNGSILVGTGLGSVVFGMFSITYINPYGSQAVDGYHTDLLKDNPEVVPNCIKFLSFGYLIIGIIGTILLYPLTKFNQKLKIIQSTIVSRTLVNYMNRMDGGQCITVSQALFSNVFNVHIMIIILSCCGNLFINTNYKLYVHKKQNVFINDKFLTLIGLVGSLGNGLTRVLWSLLFNRIGYKLIMLLLIFINIICLSLVRVLVSEKYSFLFLVFSFNAILGGLLVIAPTYSVLVFGRDIGAKIFGIFWCSFALGNFLQYIFLQTLQPIINLDNIIYICLIMNFINVFIIIIFKFSAPWQNNLKMFTLKPQPNFRIVSDDDELLIYSVLAKRNQNKLQSQYICGKNSLRIYS